MTEPTIQKLGKYQIIEEIGHGGFATVYRARDTKLEREVALKVLDPLLMRDASFVARFQHEARSAARLEHPQIVPIYDVGEGEGRLFIAMRLIRGPNLAKYLTERGHLPWEESIRILNEVGDALAYAHGTGVIHRDIKPDNILFDKRSGAMLTDFGFARLVGTSSLTQSISGGIVGTPAYIPPEIWEDAPATPATDVYALGCVVYEMLTGKTLFEGSTPMAIMRAHDRGAHLPDEWPVEIPSDVHKVLLQALAHSPKERFQTIRAFLEALNAIQTATVKRKIAERVEELSGEMEDALRSGGFAQAISLGKEILKLNSEHSLARERLQDAKLRLEKQQEILGQVNSEREQLDLEDQKRDQEAAATREQLSTLISDQETLEKEREDTQRRLEEIREQLGQYGAQVKELRQQLAGVEKEKKIHQKKVARLDSATTALQAGNLQEAEEILNQEEVPSHAAPAGKEDAPSGISNPRTVHVSSREKRANGTVSSAKDIGRQGDTPFARASIESTQSDNTAWERPAPMKTPPQADPAAAKIFWIVLTLLILGLFFYSFLAY
jgi:serine/threonine protein kinase